VFNVSRANAILRRSVSYHSLIGSVWNLRTTKRKIMQMRLAHVFALASAQKRASPKI